MELNTHEGDLRKLTGTLVHTDEGLWLIEVLCSLHSHDGDVIQNMNLFVPTGTQCLEYDLLNEKMAAVCYLQNSKTGKRKKHRN